MGQHCDLLDHNKQGPTRPTAEPSFLCELDKPSGAQRAHLLPDDRTARSQMHNFSSGATGIASDELQHDAAHLASMGIPNLPLKARRNVTVAEAGHLRTKQPAPWSIDKCETFT